MKSVTLLKLGKIGHKLTQEKIINLVIFLYIFSLFFFSHREGYHLVSNLIALTFILLIWAQFYLEKRKFIFNRFLLIHLLFTGVCFISVFFAINQSISLTKVRSLVLLFILMISLVNYIDSQGKIIKVMKYYVICGLLASLFVLISTHFLPIRQYGEQIGNVNFVGILLGISSVFCTYFIFEKKYIFLPVITSNFVVILLTGSRQSLLFFMITLIIMLISRIRGERGSMIKIVFTSIMIILLGYFIINNVPIFYQTVGVRMERLLSFVSGEGTRDRSINIRYYMMQTGWDWFKVRPLTGYGIDNYRLLFAQVPGGRETYAHNNIIELLVGIGLLGTILYYFAKITVLAGLIKASNVQSRTLCYSFIAIILGYLFMSVGLVYYYSKNVSILMATVSALYSLSENEKVKREKKISEKGVAKVNT